MDYWFNIDVVMWFVCDILLLVCEWYFDVMFVIVGCVLIVVV